MPDELDVSFNESIAVAQRDALVQRLRHAAHQHESHIELQIARDDQRRTQRGTLLCLPTRSPQDRRDPATSSRELKGFGK
jgi:hypothetical protein